MIMKHILLLLTLVMAGCSSSLPLPPEPYGDVFPVNPETVRLSDLEN